MHLMQNRDVKRKERERERVRKKRKRKGWRQGSRGTGNTQIL